MGHVTLESTMFMHHYSFVGTIHYSFYVNNLAHNNMSPLGKGFVSSIYISYVSVRDVGRGRGFSRILGKLKLKIDIKIERRGVSKAIYISYVSVRDVIQSFGKTPYL